MVFIVLYLTLSLFAMLVETQRSSQHQVCIMVPPTTEECFRSFNGKPINDDSAKINCIMELLWNFKSDTSMNEKDQILLLRLKDTIVGQSTGTLGSNTTSSAGFASTSLLGPPNISKLRKPSSQEFLPQTGKRVRKEYRLLTKEERDRFHSALNIMAMDGYIDTFAKIHDQAANIHHGGPSFLPWHRIMLLMFEETLRMYDRSVSLPYWASTLDNNMANPVNSILWTAEYFGNGQGAVTSGPAAHWVTDQGNLERDYGKASTLFTRDQINRVMSQCWIANISRPTAMPQFDFENFHGGPHVWVGGDMSSLSKTGYDPVFYMHHAYVDYLWEVFRQRQRYICRVDPSRDYPEVPTGSSNHADAPMIGFDLFTNIDGIRNQWIENWYNYQREPTCPDCCPGCPEPPPIYCDRRRYVCVSRSTWSDGFIAQPILQAGTPFVGKMSMTGQGRQAGTPVVGKMSMTGQGGQAGTPVVGEMSMPRQRGQLFDAPPSDKRTIFTAVEDTMRAARDSRS